MVSGEPGPGEGRGRSLEARWGRSPPPGGGTHVPRSARCTLRPPLCLGARRRGGVQDGHSLLRLPVVGGVTQAPWKSETTPTANPGTRSANTEAAGSPRLGGGVLARGRGRPRRTAAWRFQNLTPALRSAPGPKQRPKKAPERAELPWSRPPAVPRAARPARWPPAGRPVPTAQVTVTSDSRRVSLLF